jgi:hypothetical protein
MFGDDCGFIHILYFKSPVNSLFDPLRRKTDSTKADKATSNTVQRIFWDVSSKTKIFFYRIFFFFWFL